MTIGVVHGDCGRGPFERIADILKHGAHGHAQLIVFNRIDKRVEFRPEFFGIFRSCFYKIFYRVGLSCHLFLGYNHDSGRTGRKTILIEINFPFETNDTAFSSFLERDKGGAIAENRAGERSATITEFNAEKRITVGGCFRVEPLNNEQAGKFATAVRGAKLLKI